MVMHIPHPVLAGGGFAVRRFVTGLVIFLVIAAALAWWATDGFRAMNWRDMIEWRQYQLEQSQQS